MLPTKPSSANERWKAGKPELRSPSRHTPKAHTNTCTLNNTEIKSLDVTCAVHHFQSPPSARAVPHCPKNSTQIPLKPQSSPITHPTLLTGPGEGYRYTPVQRSFRMKDYHQHWDSQVFKKKKRNQLDDDRAKSKPKWCMKFLLVHRADPHLFWIMNSSGQRSITFLHFV